MAFSLDEIKEEINGMVDWWKERLIENLYEEYENIKREIYTDIAHEIDEQYFREYNFSMYTKERNKSLPSNVYFISDGEFVKIGKSDDVECRLKQLQTCNAKQLFIIGYLPCKNPASAMNKEDFLHNTLEKHKSHGEWYKISHKKAVDLIVKHKGIVVKESEE